MNNSPSPLTVISAAPFESSETITMLSAHNIKTNSLTCGIGPLNVAKNLTELKQSLKMQDVIFIGTCGAIDSYLALELVTFDQTIWSPIAERLGVADMIEGLHPPCTITNHANWLDLPKRLVATSPCISRTAALSSTLYQEGERIGGIVENMEAFVLAELAIVCRSFSPVFAVTNQVGPNGRQQWLEQHKPAGKAIATYLESKLIQP